MTTPHINVPPMPTPPSGQNGAPTMPIQFPTLPPLPDYPMQGTDVQRQQWLSLAQLHATLASVQATETSAAANNRLADVHGDILATQQALPGQLAGVVDDILGGWATHDAAVDRLTAAVVVLSSAAPNTPNVPGLPADGVTAGDAAIVAQILAAARPPTEG